MIVLGADTHKRSHTVAAVAAPTGELLGEQTVPVGPRGFGALLQWARTLDEERVWALEDCRHVSGSLARFLRLVAQVAPQLLTEPGFGPLVAAKLVGEIAGAQRFATAAKLARAAGVAPIPASSGTRSATGSTMAATVRSTPPCTA
jgi:transposase